jgi:hypothetical protein
MRPIIPVEILMRETADLQKSVAADLSIPDPIIPVKQKKESAKNENSPEHDRGTGNIDDSTSIPASGE